MSDYSKAKIYKITSPNCIEIYIGSTIQTLKRRFNGHKADSKRNNNTSKIVIDSGDAVIELIELFACDSKGELERREGEIQKATLNCCNYNIAGRTNKEYYIDNVDKVKEKQTKYYQLNIDKIKEYKAEYNKKNADKLKIKKAEYTKNNIDKKKEYYNKNAEKIKIQQAKYYQLKKECVTFNK